MAQMPINPDVLAWAMRDAAVDAAAIANATGRPEELVAEWLSGGSRPTKGDLQAVASRVGRSLQFFFQKTEPRTTPIEARFRAAIGDGASRDAATELAAVRDTSRLQRIVKSAAETLQHPPVVLPTPSPNPAQYADEVRHTLGWTTQDQITASGKSAVFKALRARVEELGAVVVYRDLGEGNCRGFSLADSLAPTIAINSFYKQPALRTFTLLHELAHVAHGQDSVCHFEDTESEQWCNQFAAAFLLPEYDVRAYFRYHKWDRVTLQQMDDRVRLTSNRFKASWQAVALQLRNFGLTNDEVVERAFATNGDANDPTGFAPGGGRTTPVLRYEEYGATFTRAVLDLRSEHQLSELDARRYLNVNGSELGLLRALSGGAA